MTCFFILYQKYKFESGQNTPPPTPLRIAEIFASLVNENTRGTVPSDKETQASLDTHVKQVWC